MINVTSVTQNGMLSLKSIVCFANIFLNDYTVEKTYAVACAKVAQNAF